MVFIDEKEFSWRIPDKTRKDIMAVKTIPAFTQYILQRGYECTLLLPAHASADFADDGAGAYKAEVAVKYFKFSPYWKVTDITYIIHDNGAGEYTELTYNSSASSYDDLAVGEWFYDSSNKKVVAKYNAAGTCHAYYIPARAEVEIVQKIRTPTGTTERSLMKGNISEFLLNDLSEFPVVLTSDAVLEKNHSLIIKVLPRKNAFQFDPFLPDGETLVPILQVEIQADTERIAF